MRVLHTSDWHLGASLEGISREADHGAFLEWLARTLEVEEVDVLVVAGDVFDQAHPSSEAQRLYYGFLKRISGRRVRKVVVVGGNHDSAARLDAPRDILTALDVHVVGGLAEDGFKRCLCPVPDATGGVGAVVLAVPFVHEYRLGLRTAVASAEELSQAFRERFRDFYRQLVDLARSEHADAPLIATGHLTCTGFEKGDFPIDVHRVGTIGGLPADIFDSRLQYVALGHIHRSYRVGESRAYYSGSPIPLTLREAATPRRVRLVDTAARPEDAASVRTLDVPRARAIVELSGTPKEVEAKLSTLSATEPLPPIVYARVEVERFQAGIEEDLRKVVLARGEHAPILVQVRQELPKAEFTPDLPVTSPLKDLTAEDVFRRLCQERQVPLNEELLNAFRSLAEPRESERGAA